MWQTLYQAWEPNPKPKPMEFNFKECSIDPRFPYMKLLGLKREKVGWVFRIQNPFTKTQLTGVAGRSMTQRGNERRIPHKCPDYAADALRHPRGGEPRQSQSGGANFRFSEAFHCRLGPLSLRICSCQTQIIPPIQQTSKMYTALSK